MTFHAQKVMREVACRTNFFFAGWIQQDANAGILLLNAAQCKLLSNRYIFLEQKIPNTAESHIKNRFETKGIYII